MQILLEKLQRIKPVIETPNIFSDIVLAKEPTKSQYSLDFDALTEDLIEIVEAGDLVKYIDSRHPDKTVHVTISNNINSFHEGITHSNSPLGTALLGLTIDETRTLNLPSGEVSITVKEIVKS